MLKLRWSDECSACGSALPAGSLGWWDAPTRTVTCPSCQEVSSEGSFSSSSTPQLDRGQPGASVAREYQRRKRNREVRTREAHPRIGGFLLAVRGAPQHERAFHSGEIGEREVAAALERRTAESPAIILHDRRMPGGYGNIDHLAVAPTGVFVIDAKNITGKVRVANPMFGPSRLMIAGRNRTRLIDGLERQVSVVQRALSASDHEVPVRGVLCFTSADLPLLGTLSMRDNLLVHCKALARRVNAKGPLAAPAIDTLAHRLANTLPPA
ncbi:MAG TPA: nuclease-related domain-containing protein [Solirubrobacteraceae bacterium]